MASLKHRLPTQLLTERLRLVTPDRTHIEPMARLANNRRIHAVTSRLPFPYTDEDARFFVEEIVPTTSETVYALVDRQGAFIGTCGISDEPGEHPEIGYWLGEPYWGQGYATEAAIAVVAATRAAGVRQFKARALFDNAASRNVLRKIGFEDIGEGTDQQGNLAGQRLIFMQLDYGPATLRDSLPDTIKTERLTLRAPRIDDMGDFIAQANNWRVIEPTASMPYPYGDDDARRFMAALNLIDRPRAYAITGDDDRLMGVISLKVSDTGAPELGYWLGEPHWGKGYVSEAGAALLEAIRLEGKTDHVVARVLVHNPASVRVLEKLGFSIAERTTSVIERHLGKPLFILKWSAR